MDKTLVSCPRLIVPLYQMITKNAQIALFHLMLNYLLNQVLTRIL